MNRHEKPKTEAEIKFLVISYDDDQQQWFYDTVLACDGTAAENFINKVRPYVLAANATSLAELRGITRNVNRPVKDIRADMESTAREHAESGSEGQDYIPTNYFDGEGRLIRTL